MTSDRWQTKWQRGGGSWEHWQRFFWRSFFLTESLCPCAAGRNITVHNTGNRGELWTRDCVAETSSCHVNKMNNKRPFSLQDEKNKVYTWPIRKVTLDHFCSVLALDWELLIHLPPPYSEARCSGYSLDMALCCYKKQPVFSSFFTSVISEFPNNGLNLSLKRGLSFIQDRQYGKYHMSYAKKTII